MNFKDKSLGAIATEIPMSTALFRRHDLDYYCGGKKTLKDACAEKGIALDSIVEELSELQEKEGHGPEDLSPGGITAYIVRRYHQDLRTRLPALFQLAQKVERAHVGSPELPAGLSDFLKEFAVEMYSHMDKEEGVLFPLIERGQSNFVKSPIARMEFEHEQHGQNLKRMKEMTKNYTPPANACPTWVALYNGLSELEAELMDHINLENNVLFPRALNALVP